MNDQERPPAESSTLKAMGRALRHRNYRLFFVGQGLSLIGTWITRVATSWLVYRLTGSTLVLGVVGFAGQIPTFLFAPFAGVVVDRRNRYRMLVATQALAMLQSTLLAIFALSKTITEVHVCALAVFQGVINAFDTPARQAFIGEMVEDPNDLANAIALNSSMVNGARLVGPSIAGVLIAAVGEGWCFTVDAVSYLAVLAALLAMRVTPRPKAAERARFGAELREGFSYLRSFTPVRDLLLLLAVVSLTGMPYTVLMPVFAKQVLGGGPHTLGILMGATGIGAVLGALRLAARSSVLGLGRVVVVSGAAFGAGLVVFSFSRSMWLSVPVLVVAGGGMMMQMAATNTLLQTFVLERMRGRVMSFYTMAFFGMVPFGSLASGWAAAHYGAPLAVRAGGLVTLAAVGVFLLRLPALRQHIRPIYRRMGILPDIADGIAKATDLAPPSE